MAKHKRLAPWQGKTRDERRERREAENIKHGTPTAFRLPEDVRNGIKEASDLMHLDKRSFVEHVLRLGIEAARKNKLPHPEREGRKDRLALSRKKGKE